MKTKKAKVVNIRLLKKTHYVALYTCPACKATIEDHSLRDNVTRFVCQCGQELIVNRSE